LDYLLVISTSTRQYKDGHDTALLIISKKQYTNCIYYSWTDQSAVL